MLAEVSNNFKNYLFILIISLISFSNLKAQQKAQYSQYMFNGMAINPAYIAVDEMAAVTLLNRNQWVGFDGAPNTQTISYHTPYKTSNTFYGAILTRDNVGEVITETGLNLNLTRRVKVWDESWLASGVNVGLSRYNALYSNTNIPSDGMGDPAFVNQRTSRLNFGMGVMLFSRKYYIGLSSPHFFYRDILHDNNKNTSTAYRPHFLLQGGYLFKINQDIRYKPSVLFKYVNGSPLQFDLNSSVLVKEKVWLGASYRYLDSFTALFSVYISPTILFGYSYDIPNQNKFSAQRSSHELMLQIRLPIKGRDPLACFF